MAARTSSAIGTGVWLFSGLFEQEVLEGEITVPQTIKVGDKFDFMITIHNPTTESIPIKHIVIHNTIDAAGQVPPKIWEGVNILATEPEMESLIYKEGDIQYSYFSDIAPGETKTIVFHMQAINPGVSSSGASANLR